MDFEVKEKIWQLAEPVVVAEGMELIHVECVKMHTRWIIRLFLDKEGGITLDDCANVSDQLGDIFDIREVINGSYTLEVSSPGFDRPISRDVDFLKYRNSKVNIKTIAKIDGVKNFHGILVDSIEEAGRKFVLVDVAGKVYRIPRQDILKANLADVG
ncbi:MAG TPA: ribosome maturation factor RimP [Smithella sp.]|nr:ribosome maturation factor RimP [Smithella sp.]MDM7987966.1 ribosome maturation factor RimP [Smithella sp.]HNY51274.1 ribosome maturation factor RimP [Smithella sp.]HOG91072.1 ribosome maturation factor RimP [Smithella sp.]HOU51973.1 ribosome maturation factor RimP [Smithella sp.]